MDLVPFKICSYDCIYCQLGRTTNKTIERHEFVPVDHILRELTQRLQGGPRPDFIGLAGSGEPTLHARIGEAIAKIKRLTDIPVAVLTNGSLLWSPEVRADLAEADVVMPSLDAGRRETFERVNQPHPDLSFERMTDGLVTFSREFKGKVWLEVFVLADITDCADEMRRIAAITETMRPARVQLNTVARPPAEIGALAVATETLNGMGGLFSMPCEIIAESHTEPPAHASPSSAPEDEIIALVSRRPCTVEGIARGLGLTPNEVLKHLDALGTQGAVRAAREGQLLFYEAVRNR